jgi:cytochrome b561
MLKNSEQKWGLIAQFFHWAIFLIFVNQFISADIMKDLAKDSTFLGFGKWDLYAWHKAVGVLVVLFIFSRISWRLANKAPADVSTNSKIENKLAHFMHLALYLVMIAFPISGYMMSMGGGHSVSFFGLFNLPDLIGKNEFIGDLGHTVHGKLELISYALVGLHALAALKHQFITKNGTLARMLPFGK